MTIGHWTCSSFENLVIIFFSTAFCMALMIEIIWFFSGEYDCQEKNQKRIDKFGNERAVPRIWKEFKEGILHTSNDWWIKIEIITRSRIDFVIDLDFWMKHEQVSIGLEVKISWTKCIRRLWISFCCSENGQHRIAKSNINQRKVVRQLVVGSGRAKWRKFVISGSNLWNKMHLSICKPNGLIDFIRFFDRNYISYVYHENNVQQH